MIAYRAYCLVHPHVAFPMRGDRVDALEDRISHMHTAGGHHVGVHELEVRELELELHGFPPAGYVREAMARARRDFDQMTRRA